MKLAIMQPYFFPYLGYFQLIHAADRFILYDKVNYIKKGWGNRNRILIVHGEPVYITIPIQQASFTSKFQDIRIDQTTPWRKNILNLIFYNYKKSPYFDQIFPLIETTLLPEAEFLTQINYASIITTCQFLKIPTQIITDTSTYEAWEAELGQGSGSLIDILKDSSRNLPDQKSLRIIGICQTEEADTYLNPIGGRAIYDPKQFAEFGLALYFINTLPYSYQQHAGSFFPHLSIIDVLMNCGKEGTQTLLSNYTLI